MHEVFPNTSQSDFYLQVTEINNSDEVFVSIIRKSILYNSIESLKKKNYFIVDCILGPFILNKFIQEMELSKKEFLLGFLKIKTNETSIESIETIDEYSQKLQVNIIGIALDSDNLVAFLMAINYFLRDGLITTYDRIIQDSRNFLQKKKFYLIKNASIISIFFLLLVNYLLFSNFENRNRQLREKLIVNEQEISRYEKLKFNYDNKIQYLRNNGLLEQSRISFFADILASSVPDNILLTEMNFNPIETKHDEDVEFVFHNHLIRISGECENSMDLNEWIKDIRDTNKWVKEISNLSYQLNDKRHGEFGFSIVVD